MKSIGVTTQVPQQEVAKFPFTTTVNDSVNSMANPPFLVGAKVTVIGVMANGEFVHVKEFHRPISYTRFELSKAQLTLIRSQKRSMQSGQLGS
jgi:hypothetical protein